MTLQEILSTLTALWSEPTETQRRIIYALEAQINASAADSRHIWRLEKAIISAWLAEHEEGG